MNEFIGNLVTAVQAQKGRLPLIGDMIAIMSMIQDGDIVLPRGTKFKATSVMQHDSFFYPHESLTLLLPNGGFARILLPTGSLEPGLMIQKKTQVAPIWTATEGLIGKIKQGQVLKDPRFSRYDNHLVLTRSYGHYKEELASWLIKTLESL